jgi:hypothetical protein
MGIRSRDRPATAARPHANQIAETLDIDDAALAAGRIDGCIEGLDLPTCLARAVHP